MKGTSNRGFASMDAERQREIARKGGQAAHQRGTAHEFTPDEAREAGRKGGERVSANRQHMAEIGRRGGQKSSGRRKQGGKEERSAQGGSRTTTASPAPAGDDSAFRDSGTQPPRMPVEQSGEPGQGQPAAPPQ